MSNVVFVIVTVVFFISIQYLLDKFRWQKKEDYLHRIIKNICEIQTKEIQCPIVALEVKDCKATLPKDFFQLKYICLVDGTSLVIEGGNSLWDRSIQNFRDNDFQVSGMNIYFAEKLKNQKFVLIEYVKINR